VLGKGGAGLDIWRSSGKGGALLEKCSKVNIFSFDKYYQCDTY